MAKRPTPIQLDIIRLLGSQYELTRRVFEYADGHITAHADLYRYTYDDRTQRLKIVDRQDVRGRTFTSLLSNGWIEEKDRHDMGVKFRTLKPPVRAFRTTYGLTDKGRAITHAA